MRPAVRPNEKDADEVCVRTLLLEQPWSFGNSPAAPAHVHYLVSLEVRTMRFAEGSFTFLEPMRFTASGQAPGEVLLQGSLLLDDTAEELQRERIGDLLATEVRTCDPQADYAWFYSDRTRVEGYAGRYVAVYRGRVVGSGTAKEAYQAARAAGASSPLVFRVATEEELKVAELGL